MSKDNDELNNGEDFALDDILSEFGKGTPKGDKPVVSPEVPKQKVIAFPQPSATPPPPQPAPAKDTPPPQNVVEFPAEVQEDGPATDNPIAEGINRLIKKADDYAEQMFEDENQDEATVKAKRRAERYIPGVDEEADVAPRRERKPPKPPTQIPDTHPTVLFQRYSKGLGFLRLRTVFVFFLTLPLIYLTIASFFNIPLVGNLVSREIQLYTMAGLLAGAMLLGIDILLLGLGRMFKLQMGMDTLLSFAAIATLGDTVCLILQDTRPDQLPYCSVVALCLTCTMWGAWHKRLGNRAACRTAASSREPYLVTADEGKWNGRNTYTKWMGSPLGFGRQIQGSDGAQRIFHVACPLLFVACLLFSALATVGQGRTDDFLWTLSATLTASSSLSGALCFGLPWHKISRRLAGMGAAIPGWDGIKAARNNCGILIGDQDLFPVGSISLNGIKIFGDFSVEKSVAVTATLIRDSGSGLHKVFHDLLRSQGAIYRRASHLEFHEGGGVSADIRGEQVLVGSAAFMNLMEIRLPSGLNVKNAIFCAIDNELAGIFALNYNLNGSIDPALTALIGNGVRPVLCTRDFNLIPATLSRRFKLPVDKMDFPAVERRVELSEENQEHSPILAAVLCREGLGPYAEAVVASRRLRWATRVSALVSCLGSVLGVVLAYYLAYVGAYSSLSAANLLIFMFMWSIPPRLIIGWVNQF